MKTNIIILFEPNNNSLRIVNATMDKYYKSNNENIVFHQVNINKINLEKYINKHSLENVVIYVYKLTSKTVENKLNKSNLRNCKIMYYSNDMWYKAPRLPGNKLKTNTYYLYEKIIQEWENNFKIIKAYKVNPTKLTIDNVEVSQVDIQNKLFRKLTGSFYIYETKKEAINKIIEIYNVKINIINDKIEAKNGEVIKLNKEKEIFKNKIKEMM